jgi:hypothetical protein
MNIIGPEEARKKNIITKNELIALVTVASLFVDKRIDHRVSTRTMNLARSAISKIEQVIAEMR